MNKPSIPLQIFRFVLTRRYRIHTKGLDLIKASGGKLLLPNHQSHIDPQLIAAITAPHSKFVPVVSEQFLKTPVIKHFINYFEPVAVSDLKRGNRDPHVLKKIFSQVIDALKKGKTVVIYPSGQITHSPIEKIKNKQSAYVVVSNLPENARVIGVRISGLWGSMWSVAWHGKRPNFLYAFLKGIFYFFANLIFLCPKRDVTFEFVDITDEARENAKGDRKGFNTYMEEFFNANGPDKVRYLKHFFFFPKLKRKYPSNLS